MIETRRLTLTDGAVISTSTISPKNAGNAVLNISDTLSLERNARITASTSADGNAGNIRLNVGNELLMNQNSQISTAVTRNSLARGGLIEINANSLNLAAKVS